MRHDSYGWWVREAGPPAALPSLSEAADADVVIVGGGYLGMWTAWHLLEREPAARVVLLERERCGFGPSGRNGGFVKGYWDKLDALVELFGSEPALRLARAAGDAVRSIGDVCEREGIDAWYRPVTHLEVATSAPQRGAWDDAVAACRALGAPGEYEELDAGAVARHAWSPRFGAGAAMRTAATVQPARLAFGLRERLLARGARIFEGSRVKRLAETGGGVSAEVEGGGAVRAGAAVVAVNHAAGALRPFRRLVSTASSHIVLTPPVPDVLERTGWTDGAALCDCRTMPHYFRTTNDGRIAFGWGGGRMGYGTRRRDRLDVDPGAAARAEQMLRRFFPALHGIPLDAAWGGPIDVSPIRLPQYRQAGRVFAGFGFTGNGVGPAYLGGRILSAMALDARDEVTTLPLVDPDTPRFPPEPLRFAGGAAIRAAMVRADDDADEGRPTAAPVRFVAELRPKPPLAPPAPRGARRSGAGTRRGGARWSGARRDR